MPGMLSEELEFGLASMIAEWGSPSVVLRDVTLISGSNPYPNPPTYQTLLVSGTNVQGASTVNLRGSNLNGRLLAGDSFLLGTDIQAYTVQSTVQSSGNAFTAVPIAPNLAVAHSDGESVTPTWSADTTIPALVSNFPDRLINGTTITAKDRQVRLLASAISFVPADTMKVIYGGFQYSVVSVKPVEAEGGAWAYWLHVRR